MYNEHPVDSSLYHKHMSMNKVSLLLKGFIHAMQSLLVSECKMLYIHIMNCMPGPKVSVWSC